MKSGRDRIIQAFESQVFRYCVLSATIFRVVRSLQEVLLSIPIEIRLLGIFNLFCFVIIYFILYRAHKISVIIFYSLILINTSVSWPYFGGWNGPGSYAIILALTSIPLVCSGSVLLFLLAVFGIGLVALSLGEFHSVVLVDDSEYILLQFNFILCIILLVILNLYTKNRFSTYRNYIVVINEKLGKLSKVLDAQNIELNNQREELHSMQHNLKELVAVKVDEVVKKSERLKEYAFLNAHDVRGPVARILGLISLIELESTDPKTNRIIGDIKNDTYEIDTIIRRINKVIS